MKIEYQVWITLIHVSVIQMTRGSNIPFYKNVYICARKEYAKESEYERESEVCESL